jgi:hypothetical protein
VGSSSAPAGAPWPWPLAPPSRRQYTNDPRDEGVSWADLYPGLIVAIEPGDRQLKQSGPVPSGGDTGESPPSRTPRQIEIDRCGRSERHGPDFSIRALRQFSRYSPPSSLPETPGRDGADERLGAGAGSPSRGDDISGRSFHDENLACPTYSRDLHVPAGTLGVWTFRDGGCCGVSWKDVQESLTSCHHRA